MRNHRYDTVQSQPMSDVAENKAPSYVFPRLLPWKCMLSSSPPSIHASLVAVQKHPTKPTPGGSRGEAGAALEGSARC